MNINEKGRSMIEMLGVLAIIGVLSVGGIAGYAKAMAKFRENKTIDLVIHTVTNTRILFGSQNDYADLKTDWDVNVQKMVAYAKLFPEEAMRSSGSGNNSAITFSNAYAGRIMLTEGSRLEQGDHKAFILTLTDIPQSACIGLATQDWGATAGSGFVAMRVKASAPESTIDLDFDAQLLNDCELLSVEGEATICARMGKPMTTYAATNSCSSTNSNTLYFKFY